MSAESIRRFTCDKCGHVVETASSDQPDRWSASQFKRANNNAKKLLAESVSVLQTAAKHDAWNEAVELARAKFAAEDSVDWCRQAYKSTVSLPQAMEYLDDTEDDNPYGRVYTAKEPDA